MLSNTFCHWCQWDELGTVAFSCRGMDTAVSSWSPTTGRMTSSLLCSALGTEHLLASSLQWSLWCYSFTLLLWPLPNSCWHLPWSNHFGRSLGKGLVCHNIPQVPKFSFWSTCFPFTPFWSDFLSNVQSRLGMRCLSCLALWCWFWTEPRMIYSYHVQPFYIKTCISQVAVRCCWRRNG